ncbi:DUF2663 family protein [Alteribacter natronophilus]|uniref:DUF2663 family protein n=1 Tax=Alteribacter natronophilus TaxID=2583810 RepID=UPI00110E24EE|nr:DUF2663 family protein [Alteribacter natronophilus]TMW73632.1 DUF2663 family protein [Alteribacter natronophilus]
MSSREKSFYAEFMTNALVKAKEKEKRAYRLIQRAGWMHLAVLWAAVFYMAFGIFMQYHSSFYITAILHDPVMIILIFLTVITFKYADMKKKQLDKAEKNTDRLRTEVIDRSSEIWAGENRERIYAEFLEKYNINLYHK